MNDAIVTCARGWLGTRFHHQGRLKKTATHKGGVDCLGLLVGVATELDLRGFDGVKLAEADEIDYSHQPDSVRLRQRLAGLMMSVALEEIASGDVVLVRIDDSPQHLAIISDYDNGLGMIHAYAQARGVVEHFLDEGWRSKIEAVFRPATCSFLPRLFLLPVQ